MKQTLTLFFLCCGLFSVAWTQNLVPNPSFEDFRKCPKGLGEIERTTGWHSPNTGTPDYFNACYRKPNQLAGVPNNYFGTCAAFEGEAYVGLLAGNEEMEYLQVQLKEPLVEGRRYCLRYVAAPVANADGMDDIGVRISKGAILRPDWDLMDDLEEMQVPQLSAEPAQLNWYLYYLSFTAKGGEDHLLIGYFRKPEGKAYTRIDLVRLHEYESIEGCGHAELLTAEDRDTTNFVPNPGFEQKYSCPQQRAHLKRAKYWRVAEESPDFYHECGTGTAAVPENELGRQMPRNGSGYGGIWCYLPQMDDYREFINVHLKRPLTARARYMVSLWVSQAEVSEYHLKDLQVYIDRHVRGNPSGIDIQDTHLVFMAPTAPLTDKEGWVQVRAEFEADGGEQEFVIGNFRKNDDPGILPSAKRNFKHSNYKACAYYYIDDVRLEMTAPPPAREVPKDTVVEAVADPSAWTAGDTIVLRDVLFATGSAGLRTEGTAELERLAEFLLAQEQLGIRITGHTDNQGLDAYNQSLSEARAASVAQFLRERRIGGDRMETRGMGERQPVADNATIDGRRLNRRVEIELLDR